MGIARNHDLLAGGGNQEGGARMTGWEKQQTQERLQMEPQMEQNGAVGGGLYVKVMTDEQMEVLRRQIAVYATICEQLVEMHKAVTAQQDIAGMGFGYCESLTSSAHKISARQRWTPTPAQLQILERVFEQGNGTPNKQKIKDITAELSQHGPIADTNVYNWFQNRRARSKRKQLVVTPNGGESEAEAEAVSPNDKKTKPENILSPKNLGPMAEDIYFSNPEISSCLDASTDKTEAMFLADHGLRSSSNLGELSFCDSRRYDQLIGKMEDAGGFNLYQMGGDFDMVG